MYPMYIPRLLAWYPWRSLTAEKQGLRPDSRGGDPATPVLEMPAGISGARSLNLFDNETAIDVHDNVAPEVGNLA